MSAARHVQDALDVAVPLMDNIESLLTEQKRSYRECLLITGSQLEHLASASRAVAARLAQAKADLKLIPQVDQLPHGQTIELPGRPQFVERRGANAEPAMVGRRIDDPPIVLEFRDLKGAA